MLPSVAVTGATGFIGGAVVRSLLDNGWHVRALVRPASFDKPLPAEIERIAGSLADTASLKELLRGCGAVVHCAGVVRGVRASTFMRNNAETVGRLAQVASEEAGVGRFLLVSSLAATRPQVSPYAASKHAGELALEKAGGEVSWLALRPPAVYGPGDRELLPLFKVMARGIAPLWGDRDARFSLIFIADLVSAIDRWLNSPTPVTGVYELDDGRNDGYSMDDIADIVAVVAKRPVRRVHVPSALLDVAAAANLRLAQIAGYEPMLTPWKLKELRHPRWVCDNRAFTAATGWEPRTSFVEGLTLALAGH
jgi:nucleoside-diphosphate-sugar epimerase